MVSVPLREMVMVVAEAEPERSLIMYIFPRPALLANGRVIVGATETLLTPIKNSDNEIVCTDEGTVRFIF